MVVSDILMPCEGECWIPISGWCFLVVKAPPPPPHAWGGKHDRISVSSETGRGSQIGSCIRHPARSGLSLLISVLNWRAAPHLRGPCWLEGDRWVQRARESWLFLVLISLAPEVLLIRLPSQRAAVRETQRPHAFSVLFPFLWWLCCCVSPSFLFSGDDLITFDHHHPVGNAAASSPADFSAKLISDLLCDVMALGILGRVTHFLALFLLDCNFYVFFVLKPTQAGRCAMYWWNSAEQTLKKYTK